MSDTGCVKEGYSMAAWTKAITAFLTGLVGVLAQFGITAEWASPELISAVTMALSTILVYALPNNG